MGQETQSRAGVPNLLETCGHGGENVPDERTESNQGVAALFHFDQHRGANAQSNGGEKLIRDSEQGPQTIDAAQRIQHALEQKISPERDHQYARQNNAGVPACFGYGLPEVTYQILQHETPDTGAGIENGEDEKGFEHDGEVIPNTHHRGAAERSGEDLGHADRERGRAAGTVEKRHFADPGGQSGHVLGCDREAPPRNGGGGLLRQSADDAGGAIHRKVDAGLENARGDHSHHGNEAFHQHAAVAHQACLAFLTEHFGRGSRGDERMKARKRAAGNGDETEGEDLAGKNGTGAIHEARKRRHEHGGPNRQDSHGESKDGAKLHECTEGAARSEQQPDGRDGGDEAIDYQHPGKPDGAVREMRGEARRLRDVASTEHRRHYQNKSEDGGFGGPAGPQKTHIDSHQDGDGNGHGDGEKPPGTALQRIYNHQARYRDDDGDDGKHTDERGKAGKAADLFLGHLADGFAVATNRTKEDHEILHGTRQDGANDDPQGAGKIAELRRQDGPDQRAGTGDGREMMTKDNPFIGGNEVAAIFETLGWSGA